MLFLVLGGVPGRPVRIQYTLIVLLPLLSVGLDGLVSFVRSLAWSIGRMLFQSKLVIGWPHALILV